jgi:hypothetical protein
VEQAGKVKETAPRNSVGAPHVAALELEPTKDIVVVVVAEELEPTMREELAQGHRRVFGR